MSFSVGWGRQLGHRAVLNRIGPGWNHFDCRLNRCDLDLHRRIVVRDLDWQRLAMNHSVRFVAGQNIPSAFQIAHPAKRFRPAAVIRPVADFRLEFRRYRRRRFRPGRSPVGCRCY